MTKLTTRAYKKGTIFVEDFALEDVSEYVKDKSNTVWIDFLSPKHKDLVALAEELDLHELAVEDALHAHQRPKVDYYESHLFLACHAVSMNKDDGTLAISEINAFVKGNCLITVRKDEAFSMESVFARWNLIPQNGVNVSFLLYGLLDVVIDGYLDILLEFDDYYDEIGESIFEESDIDLMHQKEWFNMRRSLVQFHRLIISMREAVNILMRREHNVISDEMLPYFHDVYDHIIRASESTDTLRDIVSTIIDTNITLRDYRQNQIMKNVTSWAAIIAIPTLITGYYGMNVPFPGYESHNGVWVASGLIITMSLALFWTFRKNDWL